jgi:hypothetical protein
MRAFTSPSGEVPELRIITFIHVSSTAEEELTPEAVMRAGNVTSRFIRHTSWRIHSKNRIVGK